MRGPWDGKPPLVGSICFLEIAAADAKRCGIEGVSGAVRVHRPARAKKASRRFLRRVAHRYALPVTIT
eukprot:756983-Hanusia_phi.AAC.1